MEREIKHPYYSLRYDAVKNRVHFVCTGDWVSRKVAPNFLKDWETIMGNCKRGWTILGDLTRVGEFSRDAEEYHAEVQRVIMSKGVRKVAQVSNAEISGKVNAFSKKSGLKKVLWAFFNTHAAGQWLDDQLEV